MRVNFYSITGATEPKPARDFMVGHPNAEGHPVPKIMLRLVPDGSEVGEPIVAQVGEEQSRS